MVEAMQRHEVDVVCPKRNRVITIQPDGSAVSTEKIRPPEWHANYTRPSCGSGHDMAVKRSTLERCRVAQTSNQWDNKIRTCHLDKGIPWKAAEGKGLNPRH